MALHIKDDGSGNKRILTEKEYQSEKTTESLVELAGQFEKITKPVGVIAGITTFMYMMYKGIGGMENTFEVVFYSLISLVCSVIAGFAAYMYFIPAIAIALLAILFMISDKIFFNDKKHAISPQSAASINSKTDNLYANPDKPYIELRNEVIELGWSVYKRNNEIKGWNNKPYPEIDYCYEDYCVSSFIDIKTNKVREIGFGICSVDRYMQCPGKPNGFERVEKDIIISRSASDENFLKLKKKFEE